jgi:hypothetical protein
MLTTHHKGIRTHHMVRHKGFWRVSPIGDTPFSLLMKDYLVGSMSIFSVTLSHLFSLFLSFCFLSFFLFSFITHISLSLLHKPSRGNPKSLPPQHHRD